MVLKFRLPRFSIVLRPAVSSLRMMLWRVFNEALYDGELNAEVFELSLVFG